MGANEVLTSLTFLGNYDQTNRQTDRPTDRPTNQSFSNNQSIVERENAIKIVITILKTVIARELVDVLMNGRTK